MSEEQAVERIEDRLEEALYDFKNATELTRPDKASKLMGQIDLVLDSETGCEVIYSKIAEISKAGIFNDTPWSEPDKLVPTLVNGTLKSGHPNSTIELLSELRLLACANGDLTIPSIKDEDALNYLHEVLVYNLEFVFNDPVEETRTVMSEHELKKTHALFNFVTERISLDGIKNKLADELSLICEQRPVVTEKQRKIIALIREKLVLDEYQASDRKLIRFQSCVYRPTEGTAHKTIDQYRRYLQSLTKPELYAESQDMAHSMSLFGLVSSYHAVLLLFLIENEYDTIMPAALGVNPAGEAEWYEYKTFITQLIKNTIHPYNAQCIYGLSKMLESGVLSREAVRSGLSNISTIKIHNKVENRILKSTNNPHPDVSALKYLMGALFRILGQPLGVGQGNNPTCQSARGISMWSQHAPAKLINMVLTVATHNDITFRFEGKEITASMVGKGLVDKLDHNLDAVSVVLVPLLDKIYNQMMVLASGRGEDPHKWVNPGLYGQWIQVGFASAYDYLTNAIVDFKGFTRVFYATCHPDFNGGHRLIYPNPVGIFITSSKGDMLGFHAVSLLRVGSGPNGEMRAYFLNPNNEGRQDWGQGIKPSVYGNGEQRGESSLPFYQFAARIYAFHYNTLEAKQRLYDVPERDIMQVEQLAKNSWGKSYTWLETKKQW